MTAEVCRPRLRDSKGRVFEDKVRRDEEHLGYAVGRLEGELRI